MQRVPDAAHADHLAGHVDDLEAVEELAPVVFEGRLVLVEQAGESPRSR